MKKIIFILTFCGCLNALYAQVDSGYIPKVGDTVRDYTFNDVINYPKESVNIKDFKGKWLVMDWWTQGCTGCIASMPKMNKIARDFKDKANVVLIGLYGKGRGRNQTKEVYADLQKRMHLSLIAAFDSVSFDQNGILAVPFILVVDPNGVIVAKTYSLDSTLLAGLIEGKHLQYEYAYSRGEKTSRSTYSYELPLLTSGKMSNGGMDTAFIFRSLLAKWNPLQPYHVYYGFNGQDDRIHQRPERKRGTAEGIGMSLPDLLRLGYVGYPYWGESDKSLYTTYNQRLILEVRDTALFGSIDLATGRNAYNYSITTPELTDTILRKTLIKDLEKSFGFRSYIETRMAPVYKITVMDASKLAKLKTRGGKTAFNSLSGSGRFTVTNYPLRLLAGTYLYKAVQIKEHFAPIPLIVDTANINYNIDMHFNASYYDWQAVINELHKYGLDLIKTEMPMKCIVVTDADPATK